MKKYTFRLALKRFLLHRSHHINEIRCLVSEALTMEALISPTMRGYGLATLWKCAYYLGDYKACRQYAVDTRKIGLQVGNSYLIMHGTGDEAVTDFIIGDEESALVNHNRR